MIAVPEHDALTRWADAEYEFELFMMQRSEYDVLHLPDAEFAAWLEDYHRLYNAVWDAQIATYQAIRALPDEGHRRLADLHHQHANLMGEIATITAAPDEFDSPEWQDSLEAMCSHAAALLVQINEMEWGI